MLDIFFKSTLEVNRSLLKKLKLEVTTKQISDDSQPPKAKTGVEGGLKGRADEGLSGPERRPKGNAAAVMSYFVRFQEMPGCALFTATGERGTGSGARGAGAAVNITAVYSALR